MVESLVLQLENVVISFLLCLCFDLHRWSLDMDKSLHHLTVFITDCFIRKRHTKMIPSTFVVLFCVSNWFLYLLVGLLMGYLVGCYVIFFFNWSVLVSWLVFGSFWCWLTARLTAPRSFHSLVSQNTSPALITMAGSPGVSGHRKFETLLIV